MMQGESIGATDSVATCAKDFGERDRGGKALIEVPTHGLHVNSGWEIFCFLLPLLFQLLSLPTLPT